MNQSTIAGSFHHLHLRADHPSRAAAWYAAQFALHTHQAQGFELASFAEGLGSGFFIWYAAGNEETARSTATEVPSNVGSTLDHFGWSVPDVDAWHARLVATGCTSLQEPIEVGSNALRISFLLDPFGNKLELLADRDLLGWHHIHLLVPEPMEHRAWWQKHFGGEAVQYNGLLPGLRQPSASGAHWWILFRETDNPLLPTLGRSIDHFAYRVPDVDQAVLGLERAGVQVTQPPRDSGPLRIAFVEGPGAVRVELVSSRKVAGT